MNELEEKEFKELQIIAKSFLNGELHINAFLHDLEKVHEKYVNMFLDAS